MSAGGGGPGVKFTNNPGEALADLARRLAKLRIFDRLHRSDGIDRRHLRASVVAGLDNHVAGQHRPHLVFELQRLMGQGGVACTENGVRSEVDTDLGLQRFPDIDPADDTEALFLKRSLCLADRLVEWDPERCRNVVAHGLRPFRSFSEHDQRAFLPGPIRRRAVGALYAAGPSSAVSETVIEATTLPRWARWLRRSSDAR